MRTANKDRFIEKSANTLAEIYDMLGKLPSIRLRDLDSRHTALVIVDMINGFTRQGALKSSNVEEVIPQVANLSKACDELGIVKLAFADCHLESSPEFATFPAHCLADSIEAEIVDEIKQIGGYTLIYKNSTNGFLEAEFQKWLKQNEQINIFIIAGDCTDICVQQFAVTAKTNFNMQNKQVRIIVPINAVETYDLGMHNREMMNIMALYNMTINGIEVVTEVE